MNAIEERELNLLYMSNNVEHLYVCPVCCFGVSHGSEWLTSGGYHCTEKCKTGERGDIEEVFWCPVVDGLSLEHVGGKDKLKWDYCTPAQTGKISENIKSNKRQSGKDWIKMNTENINCCIRKFQSWK